MWTHYISHNAQQQDFQGIWRIVHLLQSFNLQVMHSLDVPERARKLIVFMGRIRAGYPAIGTQHLALFSTFFRFANDLDG